MKIIIWDIILLAFVFDVGSSAIAQGNLITFDDFQIQQTGLITDGYGGLNWNNFWAQDETFAPQTGYQAGTITTNNVAYNFAGSPASITSATPFVLGSGYFTAAWNDSLSLEVIGINGTTINYDNTYILSATLPTDIIFNYANVTEVDFISSGGTLHGYSSGPEDNSGVQFVLDNLQLGPVSVPEPTAFALAGLGATGLLLFRRRK